MVRFVLAIVLVLAMLPAAEAAKSDRWPDCISDEPDRAIDGCTAIIKSRRTSRASKANAYYNRGNAYYVKGQYEWATSDYDQAIELNPNHADAYNNRGLTYYHTGNHAQAIAEFETAIQLDPAHASAYYNRGLVNESEKDYNQARIDYRKALGIDPGYENARKALERLDGPFRSIQAPDAGLSVGQLSPPESGYCLRANGDLPLSCSQEMESGSATRRYARPTNYNLLWLPAFRKKRPHPHHRRLSRGHKARSNAHFRKTLPPSRFTAPGHGYFRLN